MSVPWLCFLQQGIWDFPDSIPVRNSFIVGLSGQPLPTLFSAFLPFSEYFIICNKNIGWIYIFPNLSIYLLPCTLGLGTCIDTCSAKFSEMGYFFVVREGGGSPQLYYHDCAGRIPGHTTRAPRVGFELETNGFQFYAIAN